MAKTNEEKFYQMVQSHERLWGTETYHNRPQLIDVMQANVVVFWQEPDGKRHTITMHDNLGEIETFMTKMLFRMGVDPIKKRIAHIFKDQNLVTIRGISIEFGIEEDE